MFNYFEPNDFKQEFFFRSDVFHCGFQTNVKPQILLLLFGIFPRNLSLYQSDGFLMEVCEFYYRLKIQVLLTMQGDRMTEALKKHFQMIRIDLANLEQLEKEERVQLNELLCVFAMVFPSIGYHKGMAELASVFLTLLNDEAYAYFCFSSHMKRVGPNFLKPVLLSKQFEKIMSLLAFFDPLLAQRLKPYERELFAGAVKRWLLFDLSREFSHPVVQRVLEMQWAVCMNPRSKGVDFSDLDPPKVSQFPFDHVTNWLFENNVPASLEFPDFPEIPSCDEGISLEDTCFQAASSSKSTRKSFPWTASSLFPSSKSKGRKFSVSSYVTSALKDTPISAKGRKTYVVSSQAPPVIVLDEAVTNPFLLFLCTAILIENRDCLMEEIEKNILSIPNLLGNKAKQFQVDTILPRAVYLLKLYLHKNGGTKPAWSSFLC